MDAGWPMQRSKGGGGPPGRRRTFAALATRRPQPARTALVPFAIAQLLAGQHTRRHYRGQPSGRSLAASGHAFTSAADLPSSHVSPFDTVLIVQNAKKLTV
jgi:hypothetical protein